MIAFFPVAPVSAFEMQPGCSVSDALPFYIPTKQKVHRQGRSGIFEMVQKGFFIIRTNAKHPLKIVPQQTLITPAGLEYFSDIVAKGQI